MKLFCAIVGAKGSAFSVNIDASQCVGVLKKTIKAEKLKKITCDADELQLFLAKTATGEWLEDDDFAALELEEGKTHRDIQTVIDGEEMRATKTLQHWLFDKNKMPDPSTDQIHVLVVVPKPFQVVAAASTRPEVILPGTTALNEPEKYAKECESLNDWSVGTVHEIPLIHEFMRSLGECTNKGQIFWRMEDKQVMSLLVDGWFRDTSPDSYNERANKKSIVMGSPGIGKSTLLCVMAFHLVFKHKKNVLVLRLADTEQEHCLFYLGYEGGKVVQFAAQKCEVSDAIKMYKELRKQDPSNVWLLLDGFWYQDIPDGIRTFKMLTTSQQVDLKSQERIHAYCCLLPCWSKTDLLSMGRLIYNFAAEDMEDRFYYFGGSVREFTLGTLEDIRTAIDDAVSGVDDVLTLLSKKFSALTGRSRSDRLRHTFVKDTSDSNHFIARRNWEQVIDSEYAVLSLSARLRSDALFQIYTWAKGAGHGSFAGNVFKIYLHRLAADNMLTLRVRI